MTIPRVLLTVIASAYARVAGDADLVADMRGFGGSTLSRAAPRLAAALGQGPDPFVIMVDDLHELRSPACHDALGIVMEGIPQGSQFVAASRAEQPHLPRLRVAGDVLEVVADDLALDAAGAERIFSRANISITPEAASDVVARTEGWPAGVYLAAMIATHGRPGAIPVSGDDRFVADYLYRESFRSLPEADQRFLRRTAVPEQLCASLCDALLEVSDAHERLRDLAATNLFLIPLDRRREWYRYHASFREFLLGELRSSEPDVIMKLDLRAADWYEANGSPELAVDHLLRTDEHDRCVRLVTELVLPTYASGRMTTVERWLAALGDTAIDGYPPLAVLAGWVAALDGHPEEAGRWAAILDTLSFDLVPSDGSASFRSARAMLRSYMCPAGPEEAVADASLAVDEEPAGSPWRDQALGILGEALLLVGEVDRAETIFEEAAVAGPPASDAYVIAESELGLIAMDRGSWDDAEVHVRRALDAIDEHRMDDYSTSLLGFAAAGRLAVHRGDQEEARRQSTRGMRARPSATYVGPANAVRGRLQIAKVYRSIAEAATAQHLLREIDDILVHRPSLGTLVEEVAAFRDQLSSDAQAGAAGATPLTPAELRLLPYLQTHLTMREIGDRLFVSRNTVSSEVSSIYRKLGVSSRNEAVEQATAIGLLGA